ncbi:hypothetical protein D3C73_1605300 [compost metagenome]
MPVAAAGLHPIAFTADFKPPHIGRVARRGDAVGITVPVHTGQQIGAACAGGQVRGLGESVSREHEGKTHQ